MKRKGKYYKSPLRILLQQIIIYGNLLLRNMTESQTCRSCPTIFPIPIRIRKEIEYQILIHLL